MRICVPENPEGRGGGWGGRAAPLGAAGGGGGTQAEPWEGESCLYEIYLNPHSLFTVYLCGAFIR